MANLIKVITLLLVVLIAAVNSFAHAMTSWASEEECACNLLSTDSAEERDSHPVHSPDAPVDGCCDGTECCPDAGDTPISCAAKANFAGRPVFHPNTDRHIPEVYPAIFVPPEN